MLLKKNVDSILFHRLASRVALVAEVSEIQPHSNFHFRSLLHSRWICELFPILLNSFLETTVQELHISLRLINPLFQPCFNLYTTLKTCQTAHLMNSSHTPPSAPVTFHHQDPHLHSKHLSWIPLKLP